MLGKRRSDVSARHLRADSGNRSEIAAHGDLITLHADGEGAEATLDELAAMLERELDE